MGGREGGKPDGRPVDLSNPDPTGSVEARHWRALAEERDEALRALTRRPLVRLARRIDRRVAPAGRLLNAWSRRVRSLIRHIDLAIAGTPARWARRRRRTAITLEAARTPHAVNSRTVSIIVLDGAVMGSWEESAGPLPEVVAVSHARSPTDGEHGVRVNGTGVARTAAIALGAAAATGEVLCFVPSSIEPITPDWLAHLAAALHGDIVAATPTLVHPSRRGWQGTEHDLLVRSEGITISLDANGAPEATARSAGHRLDTRRPDAEVISAPLACLVVDRAAYVAAGGLAAVGDDDVGAADLCVRLRARGGRVVHVPEATVFDHRAVASRAALHRPIDPLADSWRWFVERNGPSSMLAGRPTDATTGSRWVITTAALSERVAERWGDWHLAQALARSLRQLGQEVHVQTRDRADSLAARSHDIHLVLRGLAPVRRTPGQRHIIWLISHPETFDIAECDEADLVLVASAKYANHLRALTSTPVEVFLQATDTQRFRPQPPDLRHVHPVTIVAKTRDVMRRIVRDALDAGIRPAIYGGGWHGLVDESLIISDHVDNAALPAVYNSAGVVLNDHWDTMRAWGFVSNRIFDVLACGTPIVSDDVSDIHELFGDSVPTYSTSAELGALVRTALDDPDHARAAAARGRDVVLARHTFDHRARELLDALARHGLHEAPEVTPP